jgi:hypothetical protein
MRLRYTLNNAIEGEHITNYSPKGWEETELVLKRHEKYDGIFKDYTIKADFFCGAGKEYIDTIYDTQGIEAEVTILIEMDCDDSGNYDTLYQGVLMMKTYEKVQAAPEYTRVNLMQDGIIQTVLNRLETKVNLSALETMDGTSLSVLDFAPYQLTLHSKMITKIGNYNFADEAITDPSESFPDLIPIPEGWTLEGFDYDDVSVLYDGSSGVRTLQHSFSQTIIPEITVLNEVSEYTGDASSLSRGDTYPSDNTQFQAESLIIVSSSGVPETFIISGKLRFGVRLDFDWITGNAGVYDQTASITPYLYLKVGDSITLLETKPTIVGSGIIDSVSDDTPETISVIPFTELTFEFEETVSGVTDGEDIKVYLKFDSVRTAERPEDLGTSYDVGMAMYCLFHEDYTPYEKSFIRVEQRSLAEPSTANAFMVFETGAQIARVITDQADSFRSSLFGRTNSQPYSYSSNGCGSFMSFIDGLQARGFSLSENPMAMSMNDYFEGLHPLNNLGLGVKQENGNYYILVEKKEFFYRQDVILTINSITGLTTKIDQNRFYNLVNIGYSEWEKEGTNGLDEHNSKRQFALKNKQIGKTLDIISPFVASPYALEETRRKQYVDYPTEDTKYDKSIFPICLNRTVDEDDIPTNLTEAEKDENFSYVLNVLSPETSYNLRLSPSRVFRNFFNTISTSIIKLNSILKDIKFTYGEGNYKMRSVGSEACDPANQNEVNEGGDIELLIPNASDSYEPLVTGEIDVFDAPFSKADYDLINAIDDEGIPNMYKQIAYSTTESDHLSGYTQEIRWKPIKGMASFVMARAYNRSEGCSHQYVVEGYVECDYVE